jgi:hypothetical protein
VYARDRNGIGTDARYPACVGGVQDRKSTGQSSEDRRSTPPLFFFSASAENRGALARADRATGEHLTGGFNSLKAWNEPEVVPGPRETFRNVKSLCSKCWRAPCECKRVVTDDGCRVRSASGDSKSIPKFGCVNTGPNPLIMEGRKAITKHEPKSHDWIVRGDVTAAFNSQVVA